MRKLSSNRKALLAGLLVVIGGGAALWRWFEPRTLSVCVVTDYSYRTAHSDWRDILNARFASVRRAFRGTRVSWDFRDADQPDPTARLEGGLEERRQKLTRTECHADIILGVTGLPGAHTDVPPFAHTAIIFDTGAHSWIQGMAALFGVPPAHIAADEIPSDDRALIRRVRDFDFANGTKALDGPAGDRVYAALVSSYPPADAHRIIALSLAADGHFPGAIRHFKERLRLSPSDPAARVDLATAYTHNFEPVLAVDEYRAAVALQPSSGPAHAALAVAEANAGLAEDAIDEFRAALGLDPKFLPAHSGLAYVLAQQPGRIDEAIATYEAALRLDPAYPAAVEGLDRARSLKTRAAADAAELRRKNPVPHFDLGLAEARSGNLDAAIAELNRAVEADPGNALAQQQLALLLYRKGDHPAASQHAQLAASAGMDVPRDIQTRLRSKTR